MLGDRVGAVVVGGALGLVEFVALSWVRSEPVTLLPPVRNQMSLYGPECPRFQQGKSNEFERKGVRKSKMKLSKGERLPSGYQPRREGAESLRPVLARVWPGRCEVEDELEPPTVGHAWAWS